MTLELIIFIVLVFTTFYNNGVQFYIHQEAYPLFKFVGRAEFQTYLNHYERRLLLPLMLPYGVTLLSNLALLFIRPANLPIGWVVAALILNLAVALVTVTLATPIYNRIKQAGSAGTEDMRQLMNVNLLRLLLSTASSIVIIYLLFTLLNMPATAV